MVVAYLLGISVSVLILCRILYLLKRAYTKTLEQLYYIKFLNESNENLLLHIGEMSNITMVILTLYANKVKNEAIDSEMYELADKIGLLQNNIQEVLDSYAKNFNPEKQTESEDKD